VNRHFILATAGHVDHGKSSLVKALTGIDPDRLPEEKARGITIDLGFAHLELPVPGEPGEQFRLGIVDVPGHEDFVKNMVAGVGSVDLALLVVAADDGWMPQTEEHLHILIYLGVTRMVIALTKMDLAANKADIYESVRHQLQDTPFAEAPIVPVSTVTHSGIDDLKSALASLLATTPPPRDIGKPRLAVDRAFTLRGIGTVVTGTLIGGSFYVGQPAVLQPFRKEARIRSIQSHNQEMVSVGPGTRTAINLADVVVRGHASAGASHEGVRRGDTVTLPEFGSPVSTLNVLLTRSVRLRQSTGSAFYPLKDGVRVRVHHGTGNWPARLRLLEKKELAAGEFALAQLCFDTPLFAFVNDRFIVRDWGEQTTLAGGLVLDEEPTRKKFRDPARQEFMNKCVMALGNAEARVAAQLEYFGLVRRSEFLVRSNFRAAEITTAISRLADRGKARVTSELLADGQWWFALCGQAMQLVDAAHQAHPHLVGLPMAELRAALRDRLILPDVFEMLLVDMAKQGFVQTGTVIKRTTHRAELPLQLQTTGARLRVTLKSKPFEPPSRNELAQDAPAREALRFLIDTGEVVELGPEIVMTGEAFSRATQIITQFLSSHRAGTVSELRQALGTSRRIMVPLLERLDKAQVTIRQGDQRVLRSVAKETNSRC
jgi:selenocysteine-specific elongation factor